VAFFYPVLIPFLNGINAPMNQLNKATQINSTTQMHTLDNLNFSSSLLTCASVGLSTSRFVMKADEPRDSQLHSQISSILYLALCRGHFTS
jgi:uncharacterized protein YqkB